ncbi:MAG: hypothetical protein R3200_05935 [Xanthomonadales bacterium]|nr:hypothetical protein [Xanthomonadales bacterium]
MARFLAILFATALLTGCGSSVDDLIGEWVQLQGSRPQTKLILRPDGTGKMEVKGGVNYQLDSWEIESDRHLKFSIYNQDVIARFILNDDSLEISRVEGFEEMNGTYKRVKS